MCIKYHKNESMNASDNNRKIMSFAVIKSRQCGL